MAVSVFNISGGGNNAIETSAITAAASSQAVTQLGKEQRLALRVVNDNATAIRVAVVAGDGPRSALGAMKVDVDAWYTAYVALFDTARYKDLATKEITVNLTDTSDGELTTELASIQIEAVQL